MILIYKNYRFLLCIAIVTMLLNACGGSVDADEAIVVEVNESSSLKEDSSTSKDVSSSSLVKSSSSKALSTSKDVSSSSLVKSSSSKALYPESFKPKDKEYPYAGIPRIVIETENRQSIKDRETEIPAKLQIWGEKEAESEIMDLTLRGRGNTSWTDMPKKSYKIEFEKKQSILGMPKDKDWALIANYADRTLMRNYIAYRLSAALNVYYSPRCEFAELYLNGKYRGVYLLTETIKISEMRVDVPKNDKSYIVEFDFKYRENEQVFFSDVFTRNETRMPFRVHDPKNASLTSLENLSEHINEFEHFLLGIDSSIENEVEDWVDLNECIKHYWVQEFSKNPDADFLTSVYFTWVDGEKIKLGPVWDFDLAFGNHKKDSVNTTENWYMRKYWYKYLLKDREYKKRTDEFWKSNRVIFVGVLDSIEVYRDFLEKAARNNFKLWRILGVSDGDWLQKSYESYDDVVDELKEWTERRIQWIDEHL